VHIVPHEIPEQFQNVFFMMVVLNGLIGVFFIVWGYQLWALFRPVMGLCAGLFLGGLFASQDLTHGPIPVLVWSCVAAAVMAAMFYYAEALGKFLSGAWFGIVALAIVYGLGAPVEDPKGLAPFEIALAGVLGGLALTVSQQPGMILATAMSGAFSLVAGVSILVPFSHTPMGHEVFTALEFGIGVALGLLGIYVQITFAEKEDTGITVYVPETVGGEAAGPQRAVEGGGNRLSRTVESGNDPRPTKLRRKSWNRQDEPFEEPSPEVGDPPKAPEPPVRDPSTRVVLKPKSRASDRLQELKMLHEAGLISGTDYDRRRAQILDEI
jgi:hypothetical protein